MRPKCSTLTILLICVAAVLCAFAVDSAFAGDWPTWRHDERRSASTDAGLRERLHLQWSRRLPAPEPAWPQTQYKIRFDESYEPVVVGKRLFVASMTRDSVTAYSTRTGEQLWRFYADGPVRFAPLVSDGKVYVVSDDGRLYCLDADTGSLQWKFRGGLDDKTILGNGRLVSMHPARGAPVIYDGTIYFAAGVYPFMGTFLHALDARTGEVVWTNSGSGSVYILQPHSSPSFAGVTPQGHMVANETQLIVSSGRSVPACYDRATGEFMYYHASTKKGHHQVWTAGQWLFNDGEFLELANGRPRGELPADVVLGDSVIGLDAEGIIAARSLDIPLGQETRVDTRGKDYSIFVGYPRTIWSIDTRGLLDRLHLRAGNRVYGSKGGTVAAVDLPSGKVDPEGLPAVADITWQADVEGAVSSMIAADDRLFVVTAEGDLHCFGAQRTRRPTQWSEPDPPAPAADQWTAEAQRILGACDVSAGYALCLGLGTGRLAEQLARQSDLQVIVVDPDAAAVAAFRRRMDDAGLYGRRIAAWVGNPLDFEFPPYLADLIVSERTWPQLVEAGLKVENVSEPLRPYSGMACLQVPDAAASEFATWVAKAGLAGFDVTCSDNRAQLRRSGPLAGAGSWTHQYGNVANTVVSPDALVKAPLGLLWFGGPSHLDVLPRHGHGPAPQVAAGRLIIEGIGVLSARDVYTGRVLWRRELEDLDTFGMYYNETYIPDIYDRTYNQKHIPGANELGSNYVTTADRVYLIAGPTCHVLDAATGETVTQFVLSPPPPEDAEDRWQANFGFVAVADDLLIVGAEPHRVAGDDGGRSVVEAWNARYGEGSRRIVVMDRYTGEILWERTAAFSFRHNTIIAGGGKLFCIDGLSPAKLAMMRRRGVLADDHARLLALDLRTGRDVWSADEPVFGTWLAYSVERDILIEAGSKAADRADDEIGEGLAAFRGSDGELLWHIEDSYLGPPILHHDRIITQTQAATKVTVAAKAYDLLTGAEAMRTHPLTGEPIPWTWVRFYGCNTAVASEHLLTFRSAAAAFMDLTTGQGTASLGGFKSGCTSNLVAADGVLNAPDYTRTCTCSYQNQASLALVHMPSVEMWTFDDYPPPAEPTAVRRVGLNLGAPGNRFAPDGTLWLEAPSVGGPSPDVPVWITGGESPKPFRRHSAYVSGELNWVAASGVEGARQVTVRPFLQATEPQRSEEGERLIPGFAVNHYKPRTWDRDEVAGRFDEPRPYKVRLVFAEPVADMQPGGRVFNIAIQGETLLEGFDILQAAGGANRTVVCEFATSIIDDLTITLEPVAGEPILCGVELIAE